MFGAPATPIGVADSCPMVLAQQARRYTAKVATEVANNGYCPTTGATAKHVTRKPHGAKLHRRTAQKIGKDLADTGRAADT